MNGTAETESEAAEVALSRPRIAWPTWLCALAPAAALAAMLTAALHVRLVLGHWPSFNEPVPGGAWKLHQFILAWTLVTATAVALPVWTLLLCFRDFRCAPAVHLRQTAVFLGSWAVIVLWVSIDPGRFINWYLD